MILEGCTIEDLGNQLFDRREEIRRLDAERSAVQAEFDEIEFAMIGKLQDAGLASAGITRCTFSLKQEMYPQVKDLPAFVQWAADNDKAEMLQKRVSAAVFREYYEQTNEMPEGIETYDKLTLSMRKR